MAHQARLQINLSLIFLLFLLVQCNEPEMQIRDYTNNIHNKDSCKLSMINGLLFENQIPFTGTLFILYLGTTDTAEIASFYEGKEHGEWRKYYPSKRLKEIRYFANGKKVGDFFGWWQNGQRQLHYHFENDEYEGTCKEWNESGQLSKEMNYKKGHENGSQKWWYDNGKIKANYKIINGRRFGLLGTKNCINVSDSVFK